MNDAYRALRVNASSPPMPSKRARQRFSLTGFRREANWSWTSAAASRRWLVKAVSQDPIADVDSVDEHVVSGHESSTP